MPRLSTLSNPTGLKDIDKKCVSISVDDQGANASYSLVRLDVSDISLPATTRVIVIARRGNSELRIEHGTIADWNKGFIDVSELGSDGVWIFRVLFAMRESPKLVASIEGVRPNGLGDSESFIGLEPADLGHVPWELLIIEQEGRAVIRFNRDVYASVASAEADRQFGCFVYPEAIRQLALWHANCPNALAEPVWEPFSSFLTLLHVTEGVDEESSDEDKDKWCRGVVNAFCERHGIAEQLRQSVTPGGEN